MELRKLNKIVEALLKYFPPDAEVWLDDEQIMIVNNGEKTYYSPEEILNLKSEAEINWDGISKVRAWNKGGKKRVYFQCVGIPENAHRSGKVFIELINGEWMPNMRYKLMTSLANQLNTLNIFSPEEVEEKYHQFLEN